MTLDEYYENFLTVKSTYSFLWYNSTYGGNKDVKLEEIKSENDKERRMLLTMTIPITGIPFLYKSRFTKLIVVEKLAE